MPPPAAPTWWWRTSPQKRARRTSRRNSSFRGASSPPSAINGWWALIRTSGSPRAPATCSSTKFRSWAKSSIRTARERGSFASCLRKCIPQRRSWGRPPRKPRPPRARCLTGRTISLPPPITALIPILRANARRLPPLRKCASAMPTERAISMRANASTGRSAWIFSRSVRRFSA